MTFKFARWAILLAITSILVVACGGKGSSAPPPASGITVTGGDGQVVVSWTADSNVQYKLWWAPQTSISTNPVQTADHRGGQCNVTSPVVVNSTLCGISTGIVNGQTYSFTLTGSYDSGPGGIGTPSQTTTTRVAGSTWSAGSGTSLENLKGVTWGPTSNTTNRFLAVGDNGTNGVIYQSTDGVATNGLNWNLVSTLTLSGVKLHASTYSSPNFIVAGDNGFVSYSPDLATWTNVTLPNSQTVRALASSGSTVVAVGDNGAVAYSNNSGASWTAASSVPSTTNNLLGVSNVNGVWAIVGTGGTLWKSTDASNWTVPSGLNGVPTGTLYAIAYRPAISAYSTTIPSASYPAIAATYIIVGAGGVVLSSADLATWTTQASSTTQDLFALSSSPNQFLASGQNGTVITSQDGLTWTSQNPGSSTALLGLVNAQGQYVAVGSSGTTFFSR